MSFVYHPTSFLDAKVSVFWNVKNITPMKNITFRDWVFCKDKDLIEKVEKFRVEKCSEKRKLSTFYGNPSAKQIQSVESSIIRKFGLDRQAEFS